MTRDQIAHVAAVAMDAPWDIRAWLASLILAVENDREYRRGIVSSLLRIKGAR